MKVLYALNSAQPGGMEHHVLDLVESMVKLGRLLLKDCLSEVEQIVVINLEI